MTVAKVNNELKDIAVKAGMRTLRQTGLRKVANGLTTPMCTWATSKSPARSRRRKDASGVTVRSRA